MSPSISKQSNNTTHCMLSKHIEGIVHFHVVFDLKDENGREAGVPLDTRVDLLEVTTHFS